jgi:hypothetical protein
MESDGCLAVELRLAFGEHGHSEQTALMVGLSDVVVTGGRRRPGSSALRLSPDNPGQKRHSGQFQPTKGTRVIPSNHAKWRESSHSLITQVKGDGAGNSA